MSPYPFEFKQSHTPSRCIVSHGPLPAWIEKEQPPKSRRPFSMITNHPFNRSVELLMPLSMWSAIETRLDTQVQQPRYRDLSCGVTDLLEDGFLALLGQTEVWMLSDGRIGESNVFALQGGILSSFLDQTTYESCGLPGKPLRDKASKKPRSLWRIDLDLEVLALPAGKKRLLKARQALTTVVQGKLQWIAAASPKEVVRPSNEQFEIASNLLENCLKSAPERPAKSPVSRSYHPLMNVLLPALTTLGSLNERLHEDYEGYASDFLEFIALSSLNSPLLQASEQNLALLGWNPPQGDSNSPPSADLMLVRWQGFLTPVWISAMFQVMLNAAQWQKAQTSAPASSWFVISVLGFPGSPISWSGAGEEKTQPAEDAYAVLRMPEGDGFVSWEVVGAGDSHA